ncbi:MAG: hypothetical protein O3A63_07085 [Proteobacteria bacterium]|nr:hypothetical protein [Pseudomonadota bacterium]
MTLRGLNEGVVFQFSKKNAERDLRSWIEALIAEESVEARQAFLLVRWGLSGHHILREQDRSMCDSFSEFSAVVDVAIVEKRFVPGLWKKTLCFIRGWV